LWELTGIGEAVQDEERFLADGNLIENGGRDQDAYLSRLRKGEVVGSKSCIWGWNGRSTNLGTDAQGQRREGGGISWRFESTP